MSSKKRKQEKSRSKPKVEKHVREKLAIERSLKRASELFLEPEEENTLIGILAKLDGVVIRYKGASLDDEDAQDDEAEFDRSSSISKERYMRRLLRNDRRSRKDVDEGLTVSAEKVAARIRRTITVAHRESQLSALGMTSARQSNASSVQNLSSSEVIMALATSREVSDHSKKDVMNLSSTVRVFFELDKVGVIAQQISEKDNGNNSVNCSRRTTTNLDCEPLLSPPVNPSEAPKKGKGATGGEKRSGSQSKLVVLRREQLTVTELLKQMRAKFNVGSKYNVVVIKSKQQFLSEELDFYKIQDDEVLQLSILPAVAKHSKKAAKHAADDILLSPSAAVSGPGNTEEDVCKDNDGDQIENIQVKLEGLTVGNSENVSEDRDTEIDNFHTPMKTAAIAATDKEEENPADDEDDDTDVDEKWDAAKFAQMYRDTYMHPLASTVSIQSEHTLNESLRHSLHLLQSSTRYQQCGVAAQRASLPISQLKDSILSALSSASSFVTDTPPAVSISIPHPQVLLICGETGSGKTTQVPQYLLEDAIQRGIGSTVNIVVTQPRRIAAISVAERVSYEMTGYDNLLDRAAARINDDEEDDFTSTDSTVLAKGTTGKTRKVDSADNPVLSLVGYQVRLEARVGANTRLLFCTTGLLLRRLQNPEFWSSVSHIVVDEIHERNVETDFLLTILKQELPRYPHIRLILMSATMQEKIFQDYFNQCPIIYVPGRTFPVTPHYPQDIEDLLKQTYGMKNVAKYQAKLAPPLAMSMPSASSRTNNHPKNKSKHENKAPSSSNPSSETASVVTPFFDAELIADMICAIMQKYRIPIAESSNRGQAILCFLSGIQSIEKLHKALKFRLSSPASSGSPLLCVLHGSMAPEQQRQAFRRTQPGQWKIVLATNIAETSITVDDVTHVIDTGLVKEQRYHAVSGLSILEEVFIARCNATQRAGRAGRVRAGHVWRLYSDRFFGSSATSSPPIANSVMQEFPLPEIQRIALEDVILQVLLLQLGRPEDFLSRCLQPPSIAQLRAAIATLIEVKAVSPEPSLPLTALGYHLAHLPVDVRLGKMLVYASLLQVTEPALTIAAYLSCRSSPFMSPLAQRDIARRVHSESYLGKHRIFHPAAVAGGGAGAAGNKTAAGAGAAEGGGKSDSTVGDSDHLAVVRAYEQWRQVMTTQGDSAAYAYCRRQFLSMQKMQEIHHLRSLYRRNLIRAGLLRAQKVRTAPAMASHAKAAASAVIEGIVHDLRKDRAENGGTNNDDDDDDDDEDIDENVDVVLPVIDEHEEEDETLPMDKDEEEMLVRCAMCAGFAPHIIRAVDVVVDAKRSSKTAPLVLNKRVKLVQSDQKEVRLHPSSLLCGKYATIVPETARDAFLICYLKTAVGAGVKSQQTAETKSTANPTLDANPTITTINIFDASVIPHPAILLFAGSNLSLKKLPTASIATSKKAAKHGAQAHHQQHRRCVRVLIGGWIEMELSELHVSFYRRVQEEIERVFREQVEASLSGGPKQQSRRGPSAARTPLGNFQRMTLLRKAVSLLIQSFLPKDEDDEDELSDEDYSESDEDDEDD